MCVLLAILFFINPVIATADALFSADTVLLSSSQDSEMPCHELESTELRKLEKQAHTDTAEDCCADICLCDDSGCHTSSLVFQFKSQFIFNTNQDLQYNLPIYISLAYTPVSPPPNV